MLVWRSRALMAVGFHHVSGALLRVARRMDRWTQY